MLGVPYDLVRVHDFLVDNYCSGSDEMKVSEVIACWHKGKKPHIYIALNDDETIKGVVTVHDIFSRIVPHYLQDDSNLAEFATDKLLTVKEIRETLDLPVSEIMSTDVLTVEKEDYFLEAAAKMIDHEYDNLPVVDKDEKCIGIVTRHSLDNALMELVENKSRS